MITQIYDLIYVLQDAFFPSSSHALLTQWPLVAATNLESFISFSERFSFRSYVWLCHFTTHELTIQWLASVHNITFKHMCEPQSPRTRQNVLVKQFFIVNVKLYWYFSAPVGQLSSSLLLWSQRHLNMGDFDYWIVHSVPGSLHSAAFWACHIAPPLQQSQRSHLCHNMVYSYTNQTCMNNGPVMWCHNIFCFFKVANKKQKITLIAV